MLVFELTLTQALSQRSLGMKNGKNEISSGKLYYGFAK